MAPMSLLFTISEGTSTRRRPNAASADASAAAGAGSRHNQNALFLDVTPQTPVHQKYLRPRQLLLRL